MEGIYRSTNGAHAVERCYRRLLDQWPVPHERLHLPTREGETFVVASGPPTAPPVLLLHGSSTNAALWIDVVPVWARHLRVYAVDMIGEPGLSAPSRPPMESQAYALWLDDVLGALAVERVSLVGASLGGWLAADYATRRPHRVERLVLVCPGGFGRPKVGALFAAMLVMPFGGWGRRAAISLLLAPAQGTPTPHDREYAEFLALAGQHFRPRRSLPTFDDATVRTLDMPTMVVLGDRDRLFDSHETQRRLRRLSPAVTVRMLPQTGHAVPLRDLPIVEFLGAEPRPPSAAGGATA